MYPVYDSMIIIIEFSFDPCNIYCDGPRGVGYPADARSVGDSHPSCISSFSLDLHAEADFYFYLLRQTIVYREADRNANTRPVWMV